MDTNKVEIKKLIDSFVRGEIEQPELEQKLTLVVGAPVIFDPPLSLKSIPLLSPFDTTVIKDPMLLKIKMSDLYGKRGEFKEYKKDPKAKIPFYDGIVKKRKKRS
jgi:hypothetical protein